MKKFVALLALATLIPTAASAADAIFSAPESSGPFAPVASSSSYDWTGFYLGLQGGMLGARLKDQGASVAGVADDFRFGSVRDYGIIGGGHVGYDHQIGSYVVGLEADLQATNTSFKLDLDGTELGDVDYLGTVRGKLGYAFDTTLLYVNGGLAYAKLDPNLEGFGSEVEYGYTIGAGAAYALAENLTLRTEYKYTDIEDFTFGGSVVGVPVTQSVDFTSHAIEAGISYRF